VCPNLYPAGPLAFFSRAGGRRERGPRWSTALFSKAWWLRRPGSSAPPGRGPVAAAAARRDRLISLTPGGKAFCVSAEVERRGRWRQGARAARNLAAAWRAPRLGPRAPGGGGHRHRRRHRRGGGPRAVGGGGVRDRGGCGGGLVPGWRPADSGRVGSPAVLGGGAVPGGVCGGGFGGSEREGTLGVYRSFFEGLVVAVARRRPVAAPGNKETKRGPNATAETRTGGYLSLPW
jgi:hypothetical protein